MGHSHKPASNDLQDAESDFLSYAQGLLAVQSMFTFAVGYGLLTQGYFNCFACRQTKTSLEACSGKKSICEK